MKNESNFIQNLDNKLIFEETANPLLCLFRINKAVKDFDGIKKVGCLFLWDTTIKNFDTVFSYHVWLYLAGKIHDSHNAIKTAIQGHKAAGMDFGINKPVDEWRVKFLSVKPGKMPTTKAVTIKLKPYKAKGFDAVYLEGFLNIENIQGVTKAMQSIVNQQKNNFTDSGFLKILQDTNELL